MTTHRLQVFRKLGVPPNSSFSLAELADITDLPIGALQEVYNRGIGAWKTNPESVRLKSDFSKRPDAPRSARLSKEQWAFARVYAWINKSKVFYNQDADIAQKYGVG